jgi:competence protein ComEA
MKAGRYCLALIFTLVVSALPLVAQSSSTTPPVSSAKTSSKSAGSKSSSSAAKLDINTATAEHLKALPGINDATAQKIIAGRPYHAKNDLVSKNIISKREYDSIKDLIIAHRTQGASGSKTPATK